MGITVPISAELRAQIADACLNRSDKQSEIAQRFGVSRATVCHIARGGRPARDRSKETRQYRERVPKRTVGEAIAPTDADTLDFPYHCWLLLRRQLEACQHDSLEHVLPTLRLAA